MRFRPINIDGYVDEVFGCLESEFLIMPRGSGFVEFPVFETGYEARKRLRLSFSRSFISLIVLRCMMGLTPPAGMGLLCQSAAYRRHGYLGSGAHD